MQKSGSNTFSHSKISIFQKCPKAYEYKHIQKMNELFSSIELHLGKCVHAALERAYELKDRGQAVSVDSVIGEFESAWHSSKLEVAKVVKSGRSKDDYYGEALQMLRSFYRRVLLSDISETLELEKRFTIELPDGIVYQGVIDRLSRQADGILRITDYKTGKTVADPSIDDQLASYALWVFEEFNENKIEACYEDLRNGETKTGIILRNQVPTIAGNILSDVVTVLQAKDFPAGPSILCEWCGFNPICGEAHLPITGEDTGRSSQTGKESYDHPSVCPECGMDLEQRNGRYGSFIGCTEFPHCRYTRNDW
jgi:RecB family exonuclease